MRGEMNSFPEELEVMAAFVPFYGQGKLLAVVIRPDERVLAWMMTLPLPNRAWEGPPVAVAFVQGEVYVDGDQKRLRNLASRLNATMRSMQLTEVSSEGLGGFLQTKAVAFFDISFAGRELYRKWSAFLRREFLEAVREGNPREDHVEAHIQTTLDHRFEEYLPELWERLRSAPSEEWEGICHDFFESLKRQRSPSPVKEKACPVA